jgi:Co/Zn/Cd efflux system component
VAASPPFWLARRGRTRRRFAYGLSFVEDFAGILIILTILARAITRLVHPQPVGLLWAVMVASVVGFVGNEAVAVFQIRDGQQIGSAALIAGGYHAALIGGRASRSWSARSAGGRATRWPIPSSGS